MIYADMNRKKILFFAVLGSALLALGAFAAYSTSRHASPTSHVRCDFPALLHKETSFPLFCVDPQKLPKGAVSHAARASGNRETVLFAIQDGQQTLSVSQQHKPPQDQLVNFVSNVIPLHFEVNTSVGKAYVGVSQKKTLVSLPTKDTTWILVTAPENYDPDKMTNVLQAFTKDNRP
jgi:hypothetical protein